MIECKFILIGFVATVVLFSGCKPTIDSSKDRVPAWVVGGSLQEATLDQWAEGSSTNRVATARGLLYELLWQGNLQSDESIALFKTKVDTLVQAIDDMAANQASLSKFDSALSSRTISYIIADMTRGDRELIDGLWGPTPVDDKGSRTE